MSAAHPDDAALAELAQGTLDGADQDRVESHVSQCTSCRSLVAQLLRALRPDEVAGPRKGMVVGRYVVLEPVGAGALGEVFAAYDTTLERTVALKWLYPSISGTDRAVQRDRLVAEARALAKVQHPNVVAIHDVEAQGAHDVIVMELVRRGASLRSTLANGAPWRDVISSFIDAGKGLGAAHAAGVVHRDFKPDNVLRDETGRVLVVDFGLARPLAVGAGPADSMRSTLSGTPAYLAPERWLGAPANAASDQFSFCVSAYECLGGKLPFEDRDTDARLTAMKRGPPPLPARLKVPAAIEKALARGMLFDPAHRWPSIDALTAALVSASRPQTSRSWAFAAAAVLALGGLVAARFESRNRCGSAGSSVAAVWNAGRRDAVRASFLATQHPSAQQLADRVTDALDRAAGQLATLRVTACQATVLEGESDAVLALRNACLSRRASDLDALATVFQNADTRMVERAVGAIEQLPSPRECLEVSARVAVEPMPEGAARAQVEAQIPKVSQVRALRLAGKTKDSAALAQSLIPDVRTAAWRPLIAEALIEWSNSLERLGKYDDARAHWVEGLELALAADDLSQAYDATVGLAYLDGVSAPRAQAAEAWVAMARGLIEPAGLRGSASALRVTNAEGIIALRTNHQADAARIFAKMEQTLNALGEGKTVGSARLIQNLGVALREAGDAEKGLEASKRSLAIMEAVLAPNHPDVAAALNNIGSALADLKRYDEAEPYYRRCVELREALYGPDAPALATPHYNLGELAFRRGDGTTALVEYGRSRVLVEKASGPDADDVFDARMGEGLALGLLGRQQEALATLEAVLPELQKRKMAPWNIAQAQLGIAVALKALGRSAPRVASLAQEVAALQGDRHAEQRAEAAALLK